VHARKAAQLSKRPDDVDRLLAVDVPRGAGWAPVDLGGLSAGQDERWAALVDFSAALAASPSRATGEHVARLRDLGLEPVELVDLVASVAFFSWANRLMLTLGEPYVPAPPATTPDRTAAPSPTAAPGRAAAPSRTDSPLPTDSSRPDGSPAPHRATGDTRWSAPSSRPPCSPRRSPAPRAA